MSAYTHLKALKGKGTGVADYVYIAKASDFAVNGLQCPDPVAPPPFATTIALDHVFALNKGFYKAELAPHTNEFDADFIGTLGNMKMLSKLKIFIPGSEGKFHAMMEEMLNDDLVVLIKDANCKDDFYYQLGCDCNFARIASGGFKSGKLKDGQKGYSIEIEYPTTGVLTYTGAITEAV